jgi:leucyl-tRNA synthetase
MVTKDGSAMSKSKGNVVYPEEFIEKYGADTLRLFILFASPPEKDLEWSDKGAEGCYRFLSKIWRLVNENLELFGEEFSYSENDLTKNALNLLRKTHQTIKKVTEDIEKRYHLNTAISAIMELYNKIAQYKEELRKSSVGKAVLKEAVETIILLLSPFAPHLSEELWRITNHRELISMSKWPEFKPNLIKEEEITYIVQINGKLRGKFQAPLNLSKEEAQERVLKLTSVQNHLKGKAIKRIVYVPNKLINIVI